MDVEKEEMEKDKEGKDKTTKKVVRELLNSKEALWVRSNNEIKEDEYNGF